MTPTAIHTPDVPRVLSFAEAATKDLRRLFRQYLQPSADPFFLDISGPEPRMTYEGFVEYCREDAAAWVILRNGQMTGFVLLFDIQPGLELANLDMGWFSNIPVPGSPEAGELHEALRLASRKAEVSRLQLLALPFQEKKIALCESLGFRREGMLREHFFHRGKYHDLVMLARLEPQRHGG
jgi:RimJ/RimL family protein N-acetyltransferase